MAEEYDFEEVMRKARERKDRMAREQEPMYDPERPQPSEVPALQQNGRQAADRSVIPSTFEGKQGAELSTLDRVRKIQFLDQQQGALERGEPLPEPGQAPSESNKSAWGDAKTTGKIMAIYPIVGSLTRGEENLEMRQLTKRKVWEQVAPDDQAAILEYAGAKSIDDIRWADLNRAAGKHFGHTEEKLLFGSNKVSVWNQMLESMQGYTGEEKSTYIPGMALSGGGGRQVKEDPMGDAAFPMANELISGTIETDAGFNFYESFIRPKFSNDSPQLLEDGILAINELSKGYQEETKASIDKSMVAEDATWWNPMTYFDESTKDPYHDLTGFLHTAGQQGGNIGAMIIAARLGGRGGASIGGRTVGARAGREALQRAQQIGGRIGGGVAGGGTEMILIRDGVFSEAVEGVKNLPDEVWENHEPYMDLITGGLTSEEAKQIIAYEHANNAGDMAMVLSGVMLGTPMGVFYGGLVGRSAGRQVAKESMLKQMGKGLVFESGQEATQEWVENLSGNYAKSRVDPNQDLFEGGLEAAVTGAMISMAPGAMGGIGSEKGAGVSAERDRMIRSTQGWVNAANERWKHQNKVGPNTSFAKDSSAQDQLKAMIELERLQKKEADEFEKIKDDARKLHEMGGNDDALMAFDAMAIGYEQMRANIAKQQSRRSDSRKALRVEQAAARERDDAVASVQRDVQNISTNLRLIENMGSVSRGEGLNQTGYEELVELGYGKYFGENNENFVLTKRGRRAMPELQKQAADLHDKINAGYTGPERRSDTQRRERIQEMLADPGAADTVERELYTDKQTGLRSRRAWDEEAGQANAVAVIDADSLKWVNDNMSHSAGSEFIEAIVKELRELGGTTRSYRYGGDEFIVTADNEEELKNIVDEAMSRISKAGRIEEGGQSIEVTATVGFGTDFDSADNDLSIAKDQKLRAGQRADTRLGEVPPSFKTVKDEDAPQLTLFNYNKDQLEMQDYWDEYVKTETVESKAKRLHIREVSSEHMGWINETVEEFLPGSTDPDNTTANRNNPPVTVAEDPNHLREISPRQYDELLDLGFNVWGVRGLFSLDDPTHGVFIIASNVIHAAGLELRMGDRIAGWRGARYSVEEGNQVELMDAAGENVIGYGVVEEINTAKYVPPKKSQKEKRLDNRISNMERQLANLTKKHDALLNAADFLTDEEYNNFDTPLISQLDDAFADMWDVREQLMEFRKKRSQSKATPYQPPDLSKDRMVVRAEDGRRLEFNPNRNKLLHGKTSRTAAPSDWLNLRQQNTGADALPRGTSVELEVTNKDGSKRTVDGVVSWTNPGDGRTYSRKKPLGSSDQTSISIPELGFGLTFDPATGAVRGGGNVLPSLSSELDDNLEDWQLAANEPPRLIMQDAGIKDIKIKSYGIKYAPAMTMGRVRGKVGGLKSKSTSWSYIWRTNLGNKPAAEDEVLTKRHVREMVADTLMHETVGHFGIRGITKDYKTYERLTHSIVDAFPGDAKRLQGMGYVYRKEFSASQNKALMGEEIMAHRVGGLYGFQEEMTPVQQTAVKKFLTWLKQLLLRLGFGKVYYGAQGYKIRGLEAQLKEERAKPYKDKDDSLIKALEKRIEAVRNKGFLNEDDLITIIARSHDYIRNGGQKWQFTGEDGRRHILPMRDAEIFRLPMKSVIMDDTRPLDEGEMLPDTDQQPLPAVPTVAEAYKEATGNDMPAGFQLMEISDFKDEAKRLQKEGTRTNPKKLFDEAMQAAGMSEADVGTMKQMSRIISTSVRELERVEHKQRSSKSKHEKLVRLWGQDVVDNGKIPLFPEQASIQGWMEATEDARRRGHTTKAEIEASGIIDALWPSAIDRMLQNIGSWSASEVAEVTGINGDRVDELLNSATQMTQEEAELIVKAIDDGSIPFPGVKPTAAELKFNNAITVNDLSAWAVSQFGSNQTDWMSHIFPENHETRSSYEKLKVESQSAENSIEDRQAAQRAIDDLLSSYISPTGLSLPKEWLLNAVKKPTYYYFAGDPYPPQRSRKQIYKALTGNKMPENWDRHDPDNAQMADLIQEEIEKDRREGPDIGLNPQTGTWYDPLSDYSMTSGNSWESLRVPGIIPDTYKVAVFAQHPENNVRGGHMGFSNLQERNMGLAGLQGHMRFGLAHDGDSNPPVADNPLNQGKAFTLSETQNDYGQAQTKHYATQEEEANAQSLHVLDRKAFTYAYGNYISAVYDVMLNPIETQMSTMNRDTQSLNDIAELVFDTETVRQLTFQQKIALAQITKLRELRNGQLMGTIRLSLQSVTQPYNQSAAQLSGMGEQTHVYDAPSGLMGSDARLFEILDHKAVSNMLEQVNQGIDYIENEIDQITRLNSPEELQQLVDRGGAMKWLRDATNLALSGSSYGVEIRGAVHRATQSGTNGNYRSYGFRFPWMRNESKAVLRKIIRSFDSAQIGDPIDERTAKEQADKLVDKAFNVHQGSFTFPVVEIGVEMMRTTDEVKDMIELWISNDGSQATGMQLQLERNVGDNHESVRINFMGSEEDTKNATPIVVNAISSMLNRKFHETAEQQLNMAVSNAEYQKRMALSNTGARGRGNFREEHNMEEFSMNHPYWSDNPTPKHVKSDGQRNNDTTAEEVQTILRGHEVLSSEDYIKVAWKNAWPRLEQWDRDRFDENAAPRDRRIKYLEKYNNSTPILITGDIPIEWEEDGTVSKTVQMNATRKRPNQNILLRINGEDIESFNGEYELNSAYSRVITEWYADNDVIAHPSSVLGSQELLDAEKELSEAKDKRAEYDADSVSDLQQVDNVMPTEPDQLGPYGDLAEAFDREINYHKRAGVQTIELIQRNDQWRMTHIMFMLSDMTRRGIPRAFVHPGMVTGARGGFFGDIDGVRQYSVKTNQIEWEMNKQTLRGVERDIIIINSPELNEPLWIDVTGDKLLPSNPDRDVSGKEDELAGYFSAEVTAQLGRHVAEKIGRTMKAVNEGTATQGTPQAERMLISQTAGGLYVLHNAHGDSVGTFSTEQEAETARASQQSAAAAQLQPQLNTMRGSVTRGDIDMPIHILKLGYVGSGRYNLGAGGNYQHTVNRSTMEGARRNYDITFIKNLREWVKQFGMKLEEGTMKIRSRDVSLATEVLGMPEVIHLPDAIAQRYQNIKIEEVTGQNYGWIVNTDGGLLLPNVFSNEADAKTALDAWIQTNRVPDSGYVKTWQITMNDKAKSYHKKSISPFVMPAVGRPGRPQKGTPLGEAYEKIGGSNEPRLIDRFNAWRKSWRASANVGIFDRLYGIRRALDQSGITELEAADDPYIQARMTTGLESIMRGVLEYGYPVRRDGVIENEGEGLLKVLEPIANDVELWAMYMAGVRAKRLLSEGREKLFTEEQIDAMVQLGEEFPIFKSVAAKYAKFNKKMLDFAESSGVINADTRPLWENADYIPFYRIADDRLVGPLAKGVGIANQNSPVKTLKGGDANLGDLIHNIFTNTTRLMDASIKNHAALMAIDALDGTGIINKQPHAMSRELVPMGQIAKILKQNGMDISSMPDEVSKGLQVMFAVQPPTGKGVISVLRNGKKEFWHTDDELLFRSMTAINMKAFGAWMNLLRAPKRLLTSWVTLDPGFMAANWIRDSMSAFVLSRDKFIPLAAGVKGFGQAILETESMRAMIGAGAAFDNGYINQGDPQSAQRMVKRAMKDKGFQRTVLDTPRKLLGAWKRIGSATENANRIAVYDAAIRAGKSKAQAAYESKDLMDFSMGGDWPFIQFLIQTVPFMGARMQGLHRLGRGAAENPVAFTIKGAMLTMAGMALWFAFRDDDRYKDLEEWDKDAYFHWWIGDTHYRLPKGFEVGAIFNTIPERIFEYIYSEENDAGQLLLRRWGYMIAETFNMNPIPQTFRPLAESFAGRSFFTGRDIESTWEEGKLPPERYRYYTSPTMVELARTLPKELDLASSKIRNPLHLQNLYSGYTGTIGRYIMMAADALVREQMDYPDRPEMSIAQYPVIGRFIRGNAPRRTKYEDEFYRMLRTTVQVQGSLKALEDEELDSRFDEIEKEYAPFVEAAKPLERYRKRLGRLNKEVREINMDRDMTPAEKRKALDAAQIDKNEIYKEAYELRPGAQPENQKISKGSIEFLIQNFNVDTPEANEDLKVKSPATAELLEDIVSLPVSSLIRLDKSADYGGGD